MVFFVVMFWAVGFFGAALFGMAGGLPAGFRRVVQRAQSP
ncbi:hypothetical protein SSCG_02982 [Streptomyces clavuligerus]|nr:hypothetical protein SSCG_02982 [Streptomyces clavuligerus]